MRGDSSASDLIRADNVDRSHSNVDGRTSESKISIISMISILNDSFRAAGLGISINKLNQASLQQKYKK